MKIGIGSETFIQHARRARRLEPIQEAQIIEFVLSAISRYKENWPDYFHGEYDRLARVLDHLDRALAAIVAATWSFADQDEYAPFTDEESALRWLQGQGDNSDAGEPVTWLLS